MPIDIERFERESEFGRSETNAERVLEFLVENSDKAFRRISTRTWLCYVPRHRIGEFGSWYTGSVTARVEQITSGWIVSSCRGASPLPGSTTHLRS